MVPFHLVDAFTRRAFAGNPAGVVVVPEDRLVDGALDADWAQRIAAEVRASETAFIHREDAGWRLRWWTPRTEVELCGHATLATAHVLSQRGELAPGGEVAFRTRSGELGAQLDADGRVRLDLPAWPVHPHEPPSVPVTALLGGVEGRYLGRTRVTQANDVVEVDDLEALDAVDIDVAAVSGLGGHGLIVTGAGAPGDDVEVAMRYFAPVLGVEEDPVTGSAASTTAPLWADRLGRDELVITQRSARGGHLHCRVRGTRVEVGGYAVSVVTGTITGPPVAG